MSISWSSYGHKFHWACARCDVLIVRCLLRTRVKLAISLSRFLGLLRSPDVCRSSETNQPSLPLTESGKWYSIGSRCITRGRVKSAASDRLSDSVDPLKPGAPVTQTESGHQHSLGTCASSQAASLSTEHFQCGDTGSTKSAPTVPRSHKPATAAATTTPKAANPGPC